MLYNFFGGQFDNFMHSLIRIFLDAAPPLLKIYPQIKNSFLPFTMPLP